METQAERDAAADCLVLRIRKNWLSNRRMRVTGPISPHSVLAPDSLAPAWCLETCAERDAAAECLILRTRKMGRRIGEYASGPSNIGELAYRDLKSLLDACERE